MTHVISDFDTHAEQEPVKAAEHLVRQVESSGFDSVQIKEHGLPSRACRQLRQVQCTVHAAAAATKLATVAVE